MLWEEITNLKKERAEPIKNIYQEHIQKTILNYLSQKAAFNKIVFQGGTALRLFYNNPRFSEDLDFVLKKNKQKYDLTKNTKTLKNNIKNTYPFLEETKIITQKNDRKMQRLIIKTIGENPEQKTQIHIELAYILSYQNQPKILTFPPFNPAITVEKPIEILADKITALGLREYIKGRDIWDIYYLTVEQNTSPDWALINKKIRDYGYKKKEYLKKIYNIKKQLKKEGEKNLKNEMKRFLPKPLLDQYQNQFDVIIKHIIEITKEILGEKRNEN